MFGLCFKFSSSGEFDLILQGVAVSYENVLKKALKYPILKTNPSSYFN